MPTSLPQLRLFYAAYNAAVKKKAVNNWNRKYCKLFRANAISDNPRSEAAMDELYVSEYLLQVTFNSAYKYKVLEDEEQLTAEAKLELLRLKQHTLKREAKKQ